MPTRILFVGAETYSQIGGLQQFNQRLLRALGSVEAYSVSALIMRDGEEHFPRDINVRFGSIAKRPQMIADVARRARALDVLLIGQINLLPVALAARLLNPRIRIIMFVHGDEAWNDPVYRRMRFYEPWLCRRLDRIAAVSRYTARRMAGAFHLPDDLFFYFPNAVDERGQSLPLPRSATLLSVCRLAAHDKGKHIDALIRAMPQVRQALPEARLRVVGAGVLLDELKALALSLGLADAVQFDGRVSTADLERAYLEAGAFAMPSSKEGFGIVFLEAWQHGLPVICGTMDAAHEVISDGIDGFAVHHDDIGQLAEKIGFLLGHPDIAREMAAKGAEKVKTVFSDASFRRRLGSLISGRDA
jgi:phosphatidyl-myo-inositol dimannoside synthase